MWVEVVVGLRLGLVLVFAMVAPVGQYSFTPTVATFVSKAKNIPTQT